MVSSIAWTPLSSQNLCGGHGPAVGPLSAKPFNPHSVGERDVRAQQMRDNAACRCTRIGGPDAARPVAFGGVGPPELPMDYRDRREKTRLVRAEWTFWCHGLGPIGGPLDLANEDWETRRHKAKSWRTFAFDS